MLRLSKMADYGIVLLARYAEAAHATSYSAAELAESTGLPAPTVSKCLKLLGRAGLLESQRGINGGYRLAKPATEITVAEAVKAIEGPVQLTVCCGHDDAAAKKPECTLHDCCTVRFNWQRINHALELALDGITMAEMINPRSTSVRTQARQLADLESSESG